MVFKKIHKKIRLDKDLIIAAVNLRVAVVMTDQIEDAPLLVFCVTFDPGKELPGFGRSLELLMFSIVITVFLLALPSPL